METAPASLIGALAGQLLNADYDTAATAVSMCRLVVWEERSDGAVEGEWQDPGSGTDIHAEIICPPGAYGYVSYYDSYVRYYLGSLLDFDYLWITEAEEDDEIEDESKHFCVHHMHATLGLPPRVIAEQMGWTLAGVMKLLAVYGHGDLGALEEIDQAFETRIRSLKVVNSDATKMRLSG